MTALPLVLCFLCKPDQQKAGMSFLNLIVRDICCYVLCCFADPGFQHHSCMITIIAAKGSRPVLHYYNVSWQCMLPIDSIACPGLVFNPLRGHLTPDFSS